MKTIEGDLLSHYLVLGLRPIPLKGKIPLVKWKDFTLTEKDIHKYLRPGVNWGLRTGRLSNGLWLYVIDLDKRDLLSTIIERLLFPIKAPIVSTSRGFHCYFTWDKEVKSRHFLGIDVKGEGGYVVCPPSIHPITKKEYRFIVPMDALPPLQDPNMLVAPPLIVQEATFSHAADTDKNAYSPSRYLSGVPEGQRHNTLVSYLGALYKSCFTEEEALSRALTWNRRNQPPLPKDEVVFTVNDCYRRWEEKWRQMMIERSSQNSQKKR